MTVPVMAKMVYRNPYSGHSEGEYGGYSQGGYSQDYSPDYSAREGGEQYYPHQV